MTPNSDPLDPVWAEAEIDRLSAEIERLRTLLAQAAPHVDSLLCQSVKRTGEPWKHAELCTQIKAALGKAEEQT